MKTTFSRRLALICATGLLLRLLPWLASWAHPALFMDPDSWGYQRLAANLLAGHGYSWDEQPPYEANVYRPPGLPVLLAGLWAITGVSVPAAILMQLAIAGATVALTGVLARRLSGDEKMGLIAAGLLAVDPVSIFYANFLLTEVWSALVVVAALLLGSLYLESGSPRVLILLGVLLGLAILFHPILLLTPLLLGLLPFFDARTRTPRHLTVAVLAVLIGLFPAALWIARNVMVADFAGISCVSSVNLLKYKAAGVLAEVRGTSRESERDRLAREVEERLPADATRGARWRAWQDEGLAVLRAYPGVYARVHLRGDLLELLGPERDHFLRFAYGPAVLDERGRVHDERIRAAYENAPSTILEGARWTVVAVHGCVVLLTLLGISALLRARRWALLLSLLLPAVYVLLLTGGPEASPRFRVIFTPGLCVCGAFGWRLLARLVPRSRAADCLSVPAAV